MQRYAAAATGITFFTLGNQKGRCMHLRPVVSSPPGFSTSA
jgi:hypothetical protein